MKKIFTLVTGLLLTAAVFAANRKPVVTINNNKNYKVVIDGKSYFGNNMTIRLDDHFRNNHTVKVFEMRSGFFAKKERLVDAASFQLDRKDVSITIDRFGHILIREVKTNGHYNMDDKKGRVGNKSYGPGKKDDHKKQTVPAKRF